jgi:3-hydroxy-3-methylglutaryl CoA synthase/uncharacterized OB-fold protein
MKDNGKAFGVLATSSYLPRLRLQRSAIFEQHRWMGAGLKALAKGARAMANWDEDSVTMAVEAGRAIAGRDSIAELTFVSTTAPFADRLNAGIVAAAVGLPEGITARDVGSSARAACTELAHALSAPTEGIRLIVAAERRIARPASQQEMIFGDGASAVAVGQGDALATLVSARSINRDFVDHFRESGELFEYGWEERWVRDEGYMKVLAQTAAACLAAAGKAAADVAHFVMPASLPRINEAVAKRLGIPPTAVTDSMFETAGDLGSAQALAMLEVALRASAPGALILIAAFGSGGQVLLLERTHVPMPADGGAAGRPEASYLKYLTFTRQLQPEWGMRAEMDNKTALTAAYRESGAITRFEGGQCARCATLQFPRMRVCVNPQCRALDTQSPKSLADAPARVLSHTSDWLAYSPSPPFQFGHVDFEAGARVLMEFTDTDADELRVGLPVRMVFRIKDFDTKRGFRRYFWKATPVRVA